MKTLLSAWGLAVECFAQLQTWKRVEQHLQLLQPLLTTVLLPPLPDSIYFVIAEYLTEPLWGHPGNCSSPDPKSEQAPDSGSLHSSLDSNQWSWSWPPQVLSSLGYKGLTLCLWNDWVSLWSELSLGSCLPGDSVQTSMTMSLWFPSTGVTDLHYQKLRLVYTSLLHPGWNNSPVSWVVGKGFHNTGCLMDGQCSLQEKINQKLLLTKESVAFKRREGIVGVQSGWAGHQKGWHPKNPSVTKWLPAN